MSAKLLGQKKDGRKERQEGSPYNYEVRTILHVY